MKKIFLFIIVSITAMQLFSQITTLKTKCLGGSLNDFVLSCKMINDNNFIIAGSSKSSDGDLSSNNGLADCWFMIMDTAFNILKSLSFGEAKDDIISDAVAVNDSTYILLINSNSTTGAFSANRGLIDAWIRTYNPNQNWLSPALSFGGSNEDIANHIIKKSSGGYIFCGTSQSNNGNLFANYGMYDFWVTSLTHDFMVAWSRNYGGSNYDEAIKVFQLNDGSVLVFGNTASSDGMVKHFKGVKDVWVIKLNSLGDTLWTKCYGGSNYDEIMNVVETSPGEFALIGTSNSFNGDFYIAKNNNTRVTNNYAFYYIIDQNGNFVAAANKYFPNYSLYGKDIIYYNSQNIDLYGYFDADTSINVNYDIFILNYNNGIHVRTDIWGGNSYEGNYFFKATPLNTTDILLATSTLSNDFNQYHGYYDILLATLRKESHVNINNLESLHFNIFPNPANNKIFIENIKSGVKCYYNISDLQGKTIISGKLSDNNSIDISAINNGYYIITLSTENLSIAKKILITR